MSETHKEFGSKHNKILIEHKYQEKKKRERNLYVGSKQRVRPEFDLTTRVH